MANRFVATDGSLKSMHEVTSACLQENYVASFAPTSQQTTAAMITWELYRDKVLSSFQATQILAAVGFTTTSVNNKLVAYSCKHFTITLNR